MINYPQAFNEVSEKYYFLQGNEKTRSAEPVTNSIPPFLKETFSWVHYSIIKALYNLYPDTNGMDRAAGNMDRTCNVDGS